MGAPASPFGLAYGIGQAFSGIPTVMNQRANEDLALQMNKMKVAQMMRQEKERSDVEASLANIKPEMVASITNPNPQLPSSPATPEDQAALQARGLPLNIPNAPTQEQSAALQNPMSIAKSLKVYTTPYQKASYTYNAQADYLEKMGQFEPAMRLRQLAMQTGDLHHGHALAGMATSILGGSPDKATEFARSVGLNITKIKQDPNLSDIYHVTSQGPDGLVETLVSKDDLVNATDPSKAIAQMGMNLRSQASLRDRLNRFNATQKSLEEYRSAQLKDRRRRTDLLESNSKFKNGASPAQVQTMLARKANLLAIAAENGEELSDAAAENQAWLFLKSSATAKNVPLDVAQKTLLRVEKNHYGQRPEPTDPDYAEWKQAHDKVVAAMDPPSKPITGVRTPKPGPVDKTDREKAAAAIAAAPARAEEIKAKYREITGKDY